MSTHADIEINGHEFHVESDGRDVFEIRDTIRDTIKKYKDKVDQSILIKTVVNDLIAEAKEGYGWILMGLTYRNADASYVIAIEDDGGYSILTQKGFEDMKDICDQCEDDGDVCSECRIEHPNFLAIGPR